MSTPEPSPFPVSVWEHPYLHPIRRVGAALHQRDFRYFLAGSFLSNIGSWMQSVAQAWLVLQITNSPFYLGLDGFASTLPISIFAFWGGVVADRFDRRRLLIGTQWIMLALALALGVLTQLKMIRVWQILLFSLGTGLAQSVAWPVYQTILSTIVERKNLSNAIALNSTQFNLARTIGPVVGALALRAFGTAGCFYANAASFLAVIWALHHIRIPGAREPKAQNADVCEAMKDGFRFIYSRRPLFWLLVTMAICSVLGVPMITLLPVFARDIIKIGASGLGILFSAFGAGAVVSGFIVAYKGDFPRKGQYAVGAVMAYVVAMIGFVSTHGLPLALFCLFVCGFSLVSFASVINSLVQSSAPDHLRGRAMSVFVFCFGGFMPVGNFLAGWSAKHWGAPHAILLQGALLGILVAAIYVTHTDIRDLS